MYKKQNNFFVAFLTISVLFASCSPSHNETFNQLGCLSPAISFSFPVKTADSTRVGEAFIPPSNWEVKSTIPTLTGAVHKEFGDIYFTRHIDGNVEIWLMYWMRNVSSQPQFMVYRVQSQEWEIIRAPYPDEIDVDDVDTLIIDENQTLWAMLWSKSSVTLLEFDESMRRFEVSSENRIVNNLQTKVSLAYPNTVFDGRDLWRIEDGGLYSFELASGNITKHEINISEAVVDRNNLTKYYAPESITIQDRTIAIGSSQVIYLLSNDSPELLEFNPEEGVVVRKVIPVITENIGLESANYFDVPPSPGKINGSSLFVDDLGNLWVNDFGWMEENGTWNMIIRSPLFVREQIEGLKYSWYRPDPIFQSTDNMLWFKSPNGLVSLDTKEGRWCWVTQSITNIVEDSDHNLWMIADNKLYKYALNP